MPWPMRPRPMKATRFISLLRFPKVDTLILPRPEERRQRRARFAHVGDRIRPRTKPVKCIQQNLGLSRRDRDVPRPAARSLDPAHHADAIAQIDFRNSLEENRCNLDVHNVRVPNRHHFECEESYDQLRVTNFIVEVTVAILLFAMSSFAL